MNILSDSRTSGLSATREGEGEREREKRREKEEKRKMSFSSENPKFIACCVFRKTFWF